LDVEHAEIRNEREGELPCPVSSRPRAEIKIVLGPQDRFFPKEAIELLVTRPFALTDAYDRMGVRLSGPLPRPKATLDMPSEAIARGSIQVSGDGVATVLLSDHQTTGGYPKIATVVSDHLDSLAQQQSRNQIAFASISPSDAIEGVRRHNLIWRKFLGLLRAKSTMLAQRLMAANLIDGVVNGKELTHCSATTHLPLPASTMGPPVGRVGSTPA
jgi:allophanate hydrolase